MKFLPRLERVGVQDHYNLPDSPLVDIPPCYRVLSLSGGGYRGLFTAQLLAKIEAMPEFDGEPIGKRFDMIAGTSVGGLIAIALAVSVPARRICEILVDHGPLIFPRLLLKSFKKIFCKQVYSSKPVEDAIRACIGGLAIKPFASIPKSVMLTTVSWTRGELVLLRSGNLDKISNPKECSVLDAICATSAAPAYFPCRKIEEDWFVDGGLVANCPDLHALHEAECFKLPIKMLSIGTAGVDCASMPSKIPLRGFRWAKPALDLSIQAQGKLAQQACTNKLDRYSYLHLNKKPNVNQAQVGNLDCANDDTTAVLQNLANQCFETLLSNSDQLHALRQIVSPVPVKPDFQSESFRED